ncbi:hypothetical protein Anae109_2926 [Anaeromyxobacter sp. Fw109-5]|nr:hypothetical protein Anae109_2926 [Anaeromyxobacter sp. Fw109-5]
MQRRRHGEADRDGRPGAASRSAVRRDGQPEGQREQGVRGGAERHARERDRRGRPVQRGERLERGEPGRHAGGGPEHRRGPPAALHDEQDPRELRPLLDEADRDGQRDRHGELAPDEPLPLDANARRRERFIGEHGEPERRGPAEERVRDRAAPTVAGAARPERGPRHGRRGTAGEEEELPHGAKVGAGRTSRRAPGRKPPRRGNRRRRREPASAVLARPGADSTHRRLRGRSGARWSRGGVCVQVEPDVASVVQVLAGSLPPRRRDAARARPSLRVPVVQGTFARVAPRRTVHRS